MFNRRLETINRILRSILGLFIYSFGEYLSVVANIGITPWASATMGLANIVNISFGKVEIFVSITIVVIDLLMKEKIGLGTILDAILVGTFFDLFQLVFKFNYLNNVAYGLLLLTISMFIMSVGQLFHMASGLSCGPRDSLMLGIGKRLPNVRIGYVDMLIKCVLILISLLIGGPIGAGTIYSMVAQGLIMQYIFKLRKFEPRDVKHEGLFETLDILFTNY